MITIEEIPAERIDDFWTIHMNYLVEDEIIDDPEDIDYFSGDEYRSIIKSHMLRENDKHHMVYFVNEDIRIGAAQYNTYQSEDGKWFIETATCSLLCFYGIENVKLPEIGDYSIILDSDGDAVCIIQTTNVYVTTFDKVNKEHAFKEGEGDRSLEYWKKVHEMFFEQELKSVGRSFYPKLEVVCEEFKLVKIKEA